MLTGVGADADMSLLAGNRLLTASKAEAVSGMMLTKLQHWGLQGCPAA